jgi:hypothetical protein
MYYICISLPCFGFAVVCLGVGGDSLRDSKAERGLGGWWGRTDKSALALSGFLGRLVVLLGLGTVLGGWGDSLREASPTGDFAGLVGLGRCCLFVSEG